MHSPKQVFMTKRHVIKKASEADFLVETSIAPDSVGYSRWRAVGYADGAAHTDFGMSRLEVGGSFELPPTSR